MSDGIKTILLEAETNRYGMKDYKLKKKIEYKLE